MARETGSMSGLLTPPSPGFWVRTMNLTVRLAPTGWKHYHNTVLFKNRTAAGGPVVVPAPYRWALAGPAEIRQMDEHPEATSSSAYSRRAARGDLCACLMLDGELLGYQWTRRKSCCALCGFSDRMEFSFLPLAANQAFLYDLYTYEKHRRRGIGILLRKLAYRCLRETGVEEILSLVDPENVPALGIRAALGESPERMVYGYRIRRWNKTFLGRTGDERLARWWDRFLAQNRGAFPRNPT